jgi:hypothetical protein
MGWALRDGSGNYLQSTRMSNNQHTWMDFSWDLSVDAGIYNFDIIDNLLGDGWSHIETQDWSVVSRGGISGAGLIVDCSPCVHPYYDLDRSASTLCTPCPGETFAYFTLIERGETIATSRQHTLQFVMTDR